MCFFHDIHCVSSLEWHIGEWSVPNIFINLLIIISILTIVGIPLACKLIDYSELHTKCKDAVCLKCGKKWFNHTIYLKRQEALKIEQKVAKARRAAKIAMATKNFNKSAAMARKAAK